MVEAVDHYTSGQYWSGRLNSDSTYKVQLIDELLSSSQITLPDDLTAVEVGCGQGAFLFPFEAYLRRHLSKYALTGYDISELAISAGNARLKKMTIDDGSKLSFERGSAAEIPAGNDFIFVMDVLEHVENPWLFLRELSGKTTYLLVHLPIEQSIAHLLLRVPNKSHKTFQHLHFFSWETAQILIEDSPFKLVASPFSSGSRTFLRLQANPIVKAARMLKWLLYKLSPVLAATFVGGSVMLLLECREVRALQG